jgi:uncharacterized protein (DUF2147 family)
MKRFSAYFSWVIVLVVLAVLFVPAPVSAGDAKSSALKAAQAEPNPMAGKWLRPDGGYVLQLSDVKTDGKLKAAYFNPRPINVAKAEWRSIAGRTQVFVELRDVNYPGSTYTLIYDPEKDRFEGYYYQAVMKQTFDVFFEWTN